MDHVIARKELSVFISGATGFIGRKLVKRLLDQGEEVRLLGRDTSDISGLERPNTTIRRGDVTNKDSLRAAMTGCTRVFHLAGYARNWARRAEIYHEVNVQGFRNVAAIALEQRIERMVFTSTSLTFGPSKGKDVDETTTRTDGFLTEYERSKRLAEQEGEKLLQEGLPLVTVNPTRVYGPGRLTEGNSVSRMIKLHLQGKCPFILGSGTELGNYVHVDDLVEGHLQAMVKGRVGEKYILGGDNCSLGRFFALLSRLSGVKQPRFHLPPVCARLFAREEELRARLTGRYPLITPGWVETFLRDWTFSSAKASAELGFHSRGLAAGLEDTVRWLRDGAGDP